MAIRSAIFQVLFYAIMIACMTLLTPFMLFGRKGATKAINIFSMTAMAMHRAVTGIRHERRGFERIPPAGCIVAMKHQSTWETLALLPYFPDPAFVLKQELMRIPLFGAWCRIGGMIPVDREGGVAALNEMTRLARTAVAEGRQIIIFPEGTRREAGAPPDYKLGVAQLYRDLGVPIYPVALNSGLFWPRHGLVHSPGTIVAEVLEPIPAGLEPRQAFRRMRDEIEKGCDRLLLEAQREGARLGPLAKARAEALAAVTPAA